MSVATADGQDVANERRTVDEVLAVLDEAAKNMSLKDARYAHPPDDPDFGWSGTHFLIDDTPFSCSCGRSTWDNADSVRTHIEWALREQNKALWNAGQRICNGNGDAAEMGAVLDLCRPRSEDESRLLIEKGLMH